MLSRGKLALARLPFVGCSDLDVSGVYGVLHSYYRAFIFLFILPLTLSHIPSPLDSLFLCLTAYLPLPSHRHGVAPYSYYIAELGDEEELVANVASPNSRHSIAGRRSTRPNLACHFLSTSNHACSAYSDDQLCKGP